MPIKDPEKRKAYQRAYEQERRLGLRRRGDAAAVVAEMDERAAERQEYLRRYAAERRAELQAKQTERRRKRRYEQMLTAALNRLTDASGTV